MTRVGPGRCPRCRAPVLWLPVLGELLDVEPGAYPPDQVPEPDRLVVLPTDDSPTAVGAPSLCLRRHHCADVPPEDHDGALTMPPSPTPPPAGAATHGDYQLLNRLRTRAELIRAQALGALREHPGSRRHTPMEIPRRAVETLALSPDHCVLCRQTLDGGATLTVGSVEGPAEDQLRVHSPDCPRRAVIGAAPDGP